MKRVDGSRMPDEWLLVHFILEDGESFKVDMKEVEVELVDHDSKHRQDKIKKWTLSDGNYSREFTEDDVASAMVVVKEQYRDSAKSLPGNGE